MQQLTLNFEPGLAARHSSLKTCIAAGVYQRGVEAVAAKIDRSTSHLSEALSGSDRRKFSVDELERYIEKTGDTTPVLYLVAKYLRDPEVSRQEALAKVKWLADQMGEAMRAAGLDMGL
ncbi:hypothetical protein FKV23_12790 [Lysobacter alkalisoli]|uniref:Uncharacterized protein n=1 Tax=Marilutibacter alkalisoli TaxID=2591633 RepID=A0A514BWT6_9GAMM|nr:hypothetical protein FKV23_12790 [Lysobacter alkalisoli]